MKSNRYLPVFVIVILLGVVFIGCRPRVDTMAEAEKVFIKMVDKTAAKLDLNGDQKIQLERLKSDIRENFQEGQKAKKDALTRIKEEGKREDPEIRQMTSLLQGLLRDETERINRAFDLMLEFQTSLNEAQKEKLTEMISDWVAKWD
jgi:uncharacterized membrane protein YccC